VLTKLQVLEGGLYTLIGALTPVSISLASNSELTTRGIVCLVIGSIVAGATALKAWLSKSNQPTPPAQPNQYYASL
jgi:hypothetical protein